MRALPVFLAFLLAVSPAAGGALVPASGGSGGHAVVTAGSLAPTTTGHTASNPGSLQSNGTFAEAELANRTIQVLDLPRPLLRQSSIHRQSIDLGPAVGFASNVTTVRLNTLAMVDRIESAESTADRRGLVREELERLESQYRTLRTRESNAISAYAADRITPLELMRQLAAIDAQARALEDRRRQLATLAREMEPVPVDSDRLATLQLELLTLTGPVRQEAAKVFRGESPTTQFYVASGIESVVLATIRNDTYVREAYRPDLQTPNDSLTGSFTTEDALRVTAQSFPTAWQLKGNSTEVIGSGNLYFVNLPHERGVLNTFVEGRSGRVFKTYQRRPLSTMAAANQVTDLKDGLRLRLNRTYPGGPMRINLTTEATGQPVRANITVGLEGSESRLVGQTDADGHLWTLAPRGPYTVTAIRGNSVVFVSTPPSSIPHVPANRTNDSTAVATSSLRTTDAAA
jgi:hypothetical protein